MSTRSRTILKGQPILVIDYPGRSAYPIGRTEPEPPINYGGYGAEEWGNPMYAYDKPTQTWTPNISIGGGDFGIGIGDGDFRVRLPDFGGRGDAKEATTAIVNRYEVLMKQNLQAFQSGTRDAVDAITTYDSLWDDMVAELRMWGQQGQIAIQDRSLGGKWPWRTYYRKPMEDALGVLAPPPPPPREETTPPGGSPGAGTAPEKPDPVQIDENTWQVAEWDPVLRRWVWRVVHVEPGEPEPEPEPEPKPEPPPYKPAGFPWWLGVILVGALVYELWRRR